MEKKVKDRIIDVLGAAEEIFVPVKKLLKDLGKEGCEVPTYEDFLQELRDDNRLEVMDFRKHWEEDEEDDMEDLGYYSGPRVKLRSREITREDIARNLERHNQRMLDNLVKAYEVRPDDFPEQSEDELIQTMQRAKEFKEKVEKLFDEGEKEAGGADKNMK